MSMLSPVDQATSSTVVCCLELEIRDEDGRLPQGNMFPVLTHLDSGRTWRILRYARAFDGLLFRALPPGKFRLHVASPRHETVQMEIMLAAGGRERINLQLKRKPGRQPLIIDIGGADEDTLIPARHSVSRLVSCLLSDRAVLNAVEAPLDALDAIEKSERHHVRRLLCIGFPTPRRPLAQRLFWSIVDRRCRLEALLATVFANVAVTEMLNCEPAQVADEARTAVDGLDRLDIADALMMLALYSAPWKAVMSEVCRTQAGIRDVLIPAGLAHMLQPDANPAIPTRPSARGRWAGEPSDQTVLEAGPLIARIALVIAGASEAQPAYFAMFDPVIRQMREGNA